MTIDDIQKEIKRLLSQYEIPALTLQLPMPELHKWAKSQARRLKLDEDCFVDQMSSLFWAISHVQLGLGYALIARQSCKFPRGQRSLLYSHSQVEDPLSFDMPWFHFWYHYYSTIECLYRCWERIAFLLKAACFPQCPCKLYFDGIVNKIKKDSHLEKNPNIRNLKLQVKHWSKISSLRNKLSHQDSSPIKNETKIEVSRVKIYGAHGQDLFKFNSESSNIRGKINNISEAYKRLLPAIKSMKVFIEKIKK